jgi:hypothetical protein
MNGISFCTYHWTKTDQNPPVPKTSADIQAIHEQECKEIRRVGDELRNNIASIAQVTQTQREIINVQLDSIQLQRHINLMQADLNQVRLERIQNQNQNQNQNQELKVDSKVEIATQRDLNIKNDILISDDTPDSQHCTLCCTKQIKVLYLPCQHSMCCIECSIKLPMTSDRKQLCPTCGVISHAIEILNP